MVWAGWQAGSQEKNFWNVIVAELNYWHEHIKLINNFTKKPIKCNKKIEHYNKKVTMILP